jgi:hypothetical protein
MLFNAVLVLGLVEIFRLRRRLDDISRRPDAAEGRLLGIENRLTTLERRVDALLDKVAAGSHYVTRLVEWSEKQDRFQEDILKRVAALEARVEREKA